MRATLVKGGNPEIPPTNWNGQISSGHVIVYQSTCKEISYFDPKVRARQKYILRGFMKTGFKDPIAPPEGQQKKTPWDYRCPLYDERTSCFVDAGSHFGIGHKNPVGHTGPTKQRVDTMPFGRPNTLKVANVPPKLQGQEYIE